MRLGVTSDIHYDPRGHLTPPEELESLCERMARDALDAVVLAGDLAVDLASFSACVDRFARLGLPLGVIAGNHDVWRDDAAELSSEELFRRALPEATAKAGGVWLERDSMEVKGVAVVGSMAWYDYSAVDPGVSASPEELAQAKRLMNNDAHRIDWEKGDRELAAELGEAMLARVSRACERAKDVVLVTHVPLLEDQMVRKPHDARWALSNAYFGNITLGRRVLDEPKLRAVVSGHTHFGRDREVKRDGAPKLRALVVGSDYGAPSHVVVEI